MALLDYQLPHAQQLIRALTIEGSTAIDASDTGTGKTYSGAYVAKELKLTPIVICPKAVSISWKRVLDKFDIEYLGISNYEMMKGQKWYPYNPAFKGTDELEKPITCPFLTKVPSKEALEQPYKWHDLPSNVMFIFDEAHRCKNPKTVNCKLMLSTKDLPARKLLLSATLADRPSFFAPFSVMLNMCESIEHYRLFKRKLEVGQARSVNQYIKSGQQVAMLKLHEMIFPDHGSRIRIMHLGDKFPKNMIVADTYKMDDDTVEQIRAAYASITAISVQAEAKELMAECALARMVFARMKVESLKVKTMVDLAIDSLENGNSVVIFVNYLDTMDLIAEEMHNRGHPVKLLIRGGQTMKERQNIVDQFQEDKESVMVCQIQSGGVGISLHDTKGDRPRVSIISPSWSAQDLMQSLGRIHRAGGKSICIQKLVYCHGTIEERICALVNMKLVNYLQINDGGRDTPPVQSTPSVSRPVGQDSASAEIPDDSLCVVCMNARRTHLALHVNGSQGHLCCCAICSQKLQDEHQTCPVCREPVREYVRCY
jgi:SNF2 family DNA or RNA helicase